MLLILFLRIRNVLRRKALLSHSFNITNQQIELVHDLNILVCELILRRSTPFHVVLLFNYRQDRLL